MFQCEAGLHVAELRLRTAHWLQCGWGTCTAAARNAASAHHGEYAIPGLHLETSPWRAASTARQLRQHTQAMPKQQCVQKQHISTVQSSVRRRTEPNQSNVYSSEASLLDRNTPHALKQHGPQVSIFTDSIHLQSTKCSPHTLTRSVSV